jgi:CRP-like cAMP-binding protein
MKHARSWYLQRLNLFASVGRDQLQSLTDITLVSYAKGERMSFDDRPPTVFVVAEGSAKLCRIGLLGRRVVETILSEGDLFGSIAAAKAGPAGVLIFAEKTVLIGIRSAQFEKLIRSSPDFAFRVVQLMDDRQRTLRRNVESLLMKDVTTRVIEALVSLAREHGDPCPHGWAVDIRVTQQDLADLVGATRQAVSSVLGKLERRLLLSRKKRFICILSLKRLTRLAESMGDEALT